MAGFQRAVGRPDEMMGIGNFMRDQIQGGMQRAVGRPPPRSGPSPEAARTLARQIGRLQDNQGQRQQFEDQMRRMQQQRINATGRGGVNAGPQVSPDILRKMAEMGRGNNQFNPASAGAALQGYLGRQGGALGGRPPNSGIKGLQKQGGPDFANILSRLLR